MPDRDAGSPTTGGLPALCATCAVRCAAACGLPRPTISALAAATTCPACLSVYPRLDSSIVPAIVDAVRVSPFRDATELSLAINVPRTATFVFLGCALAMFREATGRLFPDASSMVPEEFAGFREQLVADVRGRSITRLGTAVADGGDGVVAGWRCKQAFTYVNTDTAQGGMVVAVDFLHAGTASLQSLLPPSLQTTRSATPIGWSVVADVVLPRLSALLAAGGVIAEMQVRVSHTPLLLMGRYIKLRRDLSQSPWFSPADGKRVGASSLQELVVNPLLPFFFPDGLPDAAAAASASAAVAPTTGSVSSDGAMGGRGRGGGARGGGGAAPPPWKKQRHEATTAAPASAASCAPNDAVEPVSSAVPGVAPHPKNAPPGSLGFLRFVAADNVVGAHLYKFHTAGREDVDVRMLGDGRPFVIEVAAPHRTRFSEEELTSVFPATVNATEEGVEVAAGGFTVVPRDITVRLARMSEGKRKTYRCVVWSSRAIRSGDARLAALNAMTELRLQQRTPIRVVHRRSLLNRERVVHTVRAERINDHWLVLDLETQAGTYVKEFVHGDCGRTVPNLSLLLDSTTDIIQLDVTNVVTEDITTVAVPAAPPVSER